MTTQRIHRFIRMHQNLVRYGLVFVVAFLGLVIGVIPALQKDSALFTEVQDQRKDVEKLQTKASLLASYTMENVENVYMTVLSAVPSDKAVSTLMETVETVVAKHNLVIVSEAIERMGAMSLESAKTKPTGVEVFSMTLTVRGDLGDLRGFFEDIIHVRRLAAIKDVSMSFSRKTQQPEAVIKIETYYAPLPSTIGTASDSLPQLTDKQSKTLEQLSQYPLAFTVPAEQTQESQATGEPQTPAEKDPFNLTP